MKERTYLLAAILATLAVVLFAVQNLDTVSVNFLQWEFQASVALMTLTAFLAGIVAVGVSRLLSAGRSRKPRKRVTDPPVESRTPLAPAAPEPSPEDDSPRLLAEAAPAAAPDPGQPGPMPKGENAVGEEPSQPA